MMKRGFVNSHQSSASVEDSNANRKYHNLLQDYLELQKEYVSKKRKIQVAKQKREMLLDEVRFLKQRHEYLLKNSQFVEGGKPKLQNAGTSGAVRKEINEEEGNQSFKMQIPVGLLERRSMSFAPSLEGIYEFDEEDLL